MLKSWGGKWGFVQCLISQQSEINRHLHTTHMVQRTMIQGASGDTWAGMNKHHTQTYGGRYQHWSPSGNCQGTLLNSTVSTHTRGWKHVESNHFLQLGTLLNSTLFTHTWGWKNVESKQFLQLLQNKISFCSPLTTTGSDWLFQTSDLVGVLAGLGFKSSL